MTKMRAVNVTKKALAPEENEVKGALAVAADPQPCTVLKGNENATETSVNLPPLFCPASVLTF